MRKLIFSSIIDATLNRISSFFANVFLRRLSTHVAANEAADIAAIEERIAQLEEEGRVFAAERLSRYLEDIKRDDPTYDVSTSFGRQLLADDFSIDTPQLRGEPDEDGKPRRGRPRTKSAGHISQSSK